MEHLKYKRDPNVTTPNSVKDLGG